MNRRLKKLIACIMLIGMAAFLSTCSRENQLLNAVHQDWSFIQKTGGMEIGKLKVLPGGEYFLPMKIDVSNSPLAIKSIPFEIKENNITLWVQTCYGCIMYPNTTSDGIAIGRLKKGTYKVKYLNNDGSTKDMGTVEAI